MSEAGRMSVSSKISGRIVETRELLENVFVVMLLAAGLVFIACVMVIFAAGTFAALHPGADFDFGHGSGGEGDIIIVPGQPF
jgi:hypothetical protein